jgi:hypothetical protein
MDSSAFRGFGKTIVAVFWVAILSSTGFMALVVYLVWSWATAPDWQREAIQRGFATYCPDSGEFAWKGECDQP